MIINRIYETQILLFAVACFLSGGAKDLSAPLNISFYLSVYGLSNWAQQWTVKKFYLYKNLE